jgi:hypothetical protein
MPTPKEWLPPPTLRLKTFSDLFRDSFNAKDSRKASHSDDHNHVLY